MTTYMKNQQKKPKTGDKTKITEEILNYLKLINNDD